MSLLGMKKWVSCSLDEIADIRGVRRLAFSPVDQIQLVRQLLENKHAFESQRQPDGSIIKNGLFEYPLYRILQTLHEPFGGESSDTMQRRLHGSAVYRFLVKKFDETATNFQFENTDLDFFVHLKRNVDVYAILARVNSHFRRFGNQPFIKPMILKTAPEDGEVVPFGTHIKVDSVHTEEIDIWFILESRRDLFNQGNSVVDKVFVNIEPILQVADSKWRQVIDQFESPDQGEHQAAVKFLAEHPIFFELEEGSFEEIEASIRQRQFLGLRSLKKEMTTFSSIRQCVRLGLNFHAQPGKCVQLAQNLQQDYDDERVFTMKLMKELSHYPLIDDMAGDLILKNQRSRYLFLINFRAMVEKYVTNQKLKQMYVEILDRELKLIPVISQTGTKAVLGSLRVSGDIFEPIGLFFLANVALLKQLPQGLPTYQSFYNSALTWSTYLDFLAASFELKYNPTSPVRLTNTRSFLFYCLSEALKLFQGNPTLSRQGKCDFCCKVMSFFAELKRTHPEVGEVWFDLFPSFLNLFDRKVHKQLLLTASVSLIPEAFHRTCLERLHYFDLRQCASSENDLLIANLWVLMNRGLEESSRLALLLKGCLESDQKQFLWLSIGIICEEASPSDQIRFFNELVPKTSMASFCDALLQYPKVGVPESIFSEAMKFCFDRFRGSAKRLLAAPTIKRRRRARGPQNQNARESIFKSWLAIEESLYFNEMNLVQAEDTVLLWSACFERCERSLFESRIRLLLDSQAPNAHIKAIQFVEARCVKGLDNVKTHIQDVDQFVLAFTPYVKDPIDEQSFARLIGALTQVFSADSQVILTHLLIHLFSKSVTVGHGERVLNLLESILDSDRYQRLFLQLLESSEAVARQLTGISGAVKAYIPRLLAHPTVAFVRVGLELAQKEAFFTNQSEYYACLMQVTQLEDQASGAALILSELQKLDAPDDELPCDQRLLIVDLLKFVLRNIKESMTSDQLEVLIGTVRKFQPIFQRSADLYSVWIPFMSFTGYTQRLKSDLFPSLSIDIEALLRDDAQSDDMRVISFVRYQRFFEGLNVFSMSVRDAFRVACESDSFRCQLLEHCHKTPLLCKTVCGELERPNQFPELQLAMIALMREKPAFDKALAHSLSVQWIVELLSGCDTEVSLLARLMTTFKNELLQDSNCEVKSALVRSLLVILSHKGEGLSVYDQAGFLFNCWDYMVPDQQRACVEAVMSQDILPSSKAEFFELARMLFLFSRSYSELVATNVTQFINHSYFRQLQVSGEGVVFLLQVANAFKRLNRIEMFNQLFEKAKAHLNRQRRYIELYQHAREALLESSVFYVEQGPSEQVGRVLNFCNLIDCFDTNQWFLLTHAFHMRFRYSKMRVNKSICANAQALFERLTNELEKSLADDVDQEWVWNLHQIGQVTDFLIYFQHSCQEKSVLKLSCDVVLEKYWDHIAKGRHEEVAAIQRWMLQHQMINGVVFLQSIQIKWVLRGIIGELPPSLQSEFRACVRSRLDGESDWSLGSLYVMAKAWPKWIQLSGVGSRVKANSFLAELSRGVVQGGCDFINKYHESIEMERNYEMYMMIVMIASFAVHDPEIKTNIEQARQYVETAMRPISRGWFFVSTIPGVGATKFEESQSVIYTFFNEIFLMQNSELTVLAIKKMLEGLRHGYFWTSHNVAHMLDVISVARKRLAISSEGLNELFLVFLEKIERFCTFEGSVSVAGGLRLDKRADQQKIDISAFRPQFGAALSRISDETIAQSYFMLYMGADEIVPDLCPRILDSMRDHLVSDPYRLLESLFSRFYFHRVCSPFDMFANAFFHKDVFKYTLSFLEYTFYEANMITKGQMCYFLHQLNRFLKRVQSQMPSAGPRVMTDIMCITALLEKLSKQTILLSGLSRSDFIDKLTNEIMPLLASLKCCLSANVDGSKIVLIHYMKLLMKTSYSTDLCGLFRLSSRDGATQSVATLDIVLRWAQGGL